MNEIKHFNTLTTARLDAARRGVNLYRSTLGEHFRKNAETGLYVTSERQPEGYALIESYNTPNPWSERLKALAVLVLACALIVWRMNAPPVSNSGEFRSSASIEVSNAN